ncbi:MAG: zinc ribbon domain-containing protein [Desulfovibrio sp.]|nr:zinc ribbon domain-containing protein [Desulfovibrio sp.]
MPIYEYRCPQCQQKFEEWVRLSDAHGQEPCPQCGTLSPRIMSHTSFVLKGGGWYVSDYGYRKNVHEEGETSVKAADAQADSGKKAPAHGKDSGQAACGTTDAKSAEAGTSAPKTAPAKPADVQS